MQHTIATKELRCSVTITLLLIRRLHHISFDLLTLSRISYLRRSSCDHLHYLDPKRMFKGAITNYKNFCRSAIGCSTRRIAAYSSVDRNGVA